MFEDLSQFVLPFFSAFLLVVVLVLIALKKFPDWGLMDRPTKYGLRRKPIPYYGGLAIFFAFLIAALSFLPWDLNLLGMLSAGALIVLVGFLDDYFEVSPWVRIFIQFLAAVILAIAGIGILSINLPFFGTIAFGDSFLLSAGFTVVWMIAIVNAMNFLDGVSGLSSGVGIVAALTVFFLSIHPGVHEDPASQMGLAKVAVILAGVCLGFFLFEFPKPRILMGDTGSTFLGFLLATLAIYSGGKLATAFLVLGLPLLDAVWVILRRTFSGRKFWHGGDRAHLHHQLLDLGFSTSMVVLFYLLITALFGAAAVLFVNSQQKFFVIIGLFILSLFLAFSLTLLPKRK